MAIVELSTTSASGVALHHGSGSHAELFVENGPWTFSVIMSASEMSLDQQWDAFVDSIHLTLHPD